MSCYVSLGRFAIAAKHVMSIAEMCEKELNNAEKAVEYYQKVTRTKTCTARIEVEESSLLMNPSLLFIFSIIRLLTSTKARSRAAPRTRRCLRYIYIF